MTDKTLEAQFQTALLNAIRQAETLGIPQKRLAQNIQTYGALSTVRTLIRRRQPSDGYLPLEEHHRLDLTVEALVTQSKYGDLFTDQEVNHCFDLLCDSGYYR